MSIRFPLKAVIQSDNSTEVGAGSVAGGVAIPFILPQDTDNVVVKFTASVAGGGVSATFQTSDDGGTTWYDLARTSVVSNANATTAQWLSVPTINAGTATGVVKAASVLSTGIGSAAASTLGSQQISGLPILGQAARVFLILPSTVTAAASNSLITTVYVNNQSNTA